MALTIQIKRLEDTKLPCYSYAGDAGLDFCSSEDVILAPGERKGIKTGIAVAIPDGYVGLLWDKSGISIKGGLKTLGGVIDSGYRGEVLVGLVNLSDEPYMIARGDKLAQMVVQKKEMVEIEEVDVLSESERGERAFGSSGR